MVNEELGYTVPSRLEVCIWVVLAIVLAAFGIWVYPLTAVVLLLFIPFVWADLYGAILHYALDTPEFTSLPIVGEPIFVQFQTRRFPGWVNTIHRKPNIDLFGELNVFSIITLPFWILFLGLFDRALYVAWGFLMLSGCYGQLRHRWAHQPRGARPTVARALQRKGLAINLQDRWIHHTHEKFGANFVVASGSTNLILNGGF